MTSSFPYLTTLILVPAGAAVVVALVPKAQRQLVQLVGYLASLAVLGIASAATVAFTAGDGGYQFVSTHQWVPAFGISWNLGMDGISLFLVLMTALLFPIALAASSERAGDKSFVAWILVLEAGCLGGFLALDLLVFFVFFELTLVPVYFLIAGWGHERRGYAAGKFFLYTLGASAFLFVGILALVAIHSSQTGVTTFDVRALANTHLSGTAGVLLFLAFTAAFAVKMPLFPFHTWSPDAYREAPAAGSLLLAGVMAKLGAYGIIRFDLALFPRAVVTLAPLLITLGAIGIIYGAVVAAVERDLKRLVAYSSLAHLGFIVIGAFALSRRGLDRRGAADDQPRPLHRSPVHPHRPALPATGHVLGQGDARPAAARALARGRVHGRDARLDRRAGPERLRGGVPHPRRHLPDPSLVGRRGDRRSRPRRGVPPVGLPAGLPRQALRRAGRDPGSLLA